MKHDLNTSQDVQFARFSHEDYGQVCDFLIALNRQDKAHMNWNWARWEWMYSHPYFDKTLTDTIGLWKADGRIVGAAIYDLYHGEAFCGALEGFSELLPEILEYAYRALKDEHGLGIAVNDRDTRTKDLLVKSRYHKAEQAETVLRLCLEQIPEYALPEGYRIREIHFPEDELAYQTVLWKGFDHADDPGELERMLQNKAIPPHRESKLCLAVVAGSGEFVSHCTCWYAEGTDYAYVEPVCTVPEHRGKGLGKAVVLEALQRCKALGAKDAFVISDQQFYQKLGFAPYSHYTFYWKP